MLIILLSGKFHSSMNNKMLNHKGPCTHRSLRKPGMLNMQRLLLSAEDKIPAFNPKGWEWNLLMTSLLAVGADLTYLLLQRQTLPKFSRMIISDYFFPRQLPIWVTKDVTLYVKGDRIPSFLWSLELGGDRCTPLCKGWESTQFSMRTR